MAMANTGSGARALGTPTMRNTLSSTMCSTKFTTCAPLKPASLRTDGAVPKVKYDVSTKFAMNEST